MRHIPATTHQHRATRRGQARARAVVMPRSTALKALSLLLPLLLLFLLALGQAASAHPAGSQHQPHATQTLSHHAKADAGCCDLSQDKDAKACLAQCLASCSYCAPVPLAAVFPELIGVSPRPAKTEPLHGAIASPHLRPPSFS